MRGVRMRDSMQFAAPDCRLFLVGSVGETSMPRIESIEELSVVALDDQDPQPVLLVTGLLRQLAAAARGP